MFMKHYVHFLSPGTFVSEQTVREIAGWDVDAAMEMAHEITERHNATPYGFQFSTRSRADDEFEPKETARSGTYYLGGRIETLADVQARNSPDETILRANMECNDISRVLVNDNSWRSTTPFRDGDVLLEWTPRPKADSAA